MYVCVYNVEHYIDTCIINVFNPCMYKCVCVCMFVRSIFLTFMTPIIYFVHARLLKNAWIEEFRYQIILMWTVRRFCIGMWVFSLENNRWRISDTAWQNCYQFVLSHWLTPTAPNHYGRHPYTFYLFYYIIYVLVIDKPL